MSWTIDSTGLMFIALVCTGVGFLFGLLISLFRSGNPRAKAPKKDLTEIVNLWRDKKDDQLWVEINGQTVSKLDDLSDENRSQVILAGKQLAHLVADEMPPSTVQPQSIRNQAAPLTEENPASMSQAPSQMQNEKAWESTSIDLTSADNMQNEKPRIDIVKGLRLTLEGDSSRAQPTLSIAAQVDEILQEKIKGTNLEKKGIRLMELPGQGMVVMVGMEKFDFVDEVPYPEIKAVLKDSVAVWEDKMLS